MSTHAAYVPRRRRDPRGRGFHPSGSISVASRAAPSVPVAAASESHYHRAALASAVEGRRAQLLLTPDVVHRPAARGVMLVALHGHPEEETVAWKRRVRGRDLIMPLGAEADAEPDADAAKEDPFAAASPLGPHYTACAAAAEALRVAHEEGAHLLWLGVRARVHFEGPPQPSPIAQLLRAAEQDTGGSVCIGAGGDAALVHHGFLVLARRILSRVMRTNYAAADRLVPFGKEFADALARLSAGSQSSAVPFPLRIEAAPRSEPPTPPSTKISEETPSLRSGFAVNPLRGSGSSHAAGSSLGALRSSSAPGWNLTYRLSGSAAVRAFGGTQA
jgi:hypothetical protein